MPNLSLNELKQIAKMRRTKAYKSISKERLLSALDESEFNFNNARTKKKIREDFSKLRNRFLKPKIKEIRRNLYEIENKKNLSQSKIKEIEQNFIELEESLFNLNKYYDYDDIKCKGIKDVAHLFNGVALKGIAFNHLIDEDYYRPIRTKSAFNGNYIRYESKRDKDKKLSPKEYLDMIKPCLSDIINDHKTPKNLRVHSSNNEVIDHETHFGECYAYQEP